MIVASNKVAEFLQKQDVRSPRIIYPFLSWDHANFGWWTQAHLKIFGHAITSMNKTTFYFILVILILVDVVQTAYQKNILREKLIQISFVKFEYENCFSFVLLFCHFILSSQQSGFIFIENKGQWHHDVYSKQI